MAVLQSANYPGFKSVSLREAVGKAELDLSPLVSLLDYPEEVLNEDSKRLKNTDVPNRVYAANISADYRQCLHSNYRKPRMNAGEQSYHLKLTKINAF